MGAHQKYRTVPAGEFKATCLALLDEVARSGQTLIITKRGRPVAQLGPAVGSKPKSLLGSVTYTGDIEAAIDVEWDVDP